MPSSYYETELATHRNFLNAIHTQANITLDRGI